MSLTGRDIIKSGMRLIGALASGDDPSTDELNDSLLILNRIMRALHGTVIGPRLSPQPFVATGQAENGGMYQCAITAAATLTAPAKPRNGARFGVVDVKANFTTFNLTVAPNGQLIEAAAASLVLATSGTSRVWFFDGISGNWIKEADLATVDTSPPYPDGLIAYLPQMFAVAYQAENGGDIRQDTIALAGEGRSAFARTYARRGRNQGDAPIGAAVPQTVGGQ